MDRHALYLIADCSGSMAESGKSAVLAGLLSYVRTCERFGTLPDWCTQVKFVAWGETVTLLELESGAPLSALACVGRAQPASLFSLIERDGAGAVRILLLSDGGLDPADRRAWQVWRASYAGTAPEIRAVAIGADAALSTLEALAGKSGMFAAEDIGAALRDWTVGAVVRTEPWCLDDTRPTKAADTDDWA